MVAFRSATSILLLRDFNHSGAFNVARFSEPKALRTNAFGSGDVKLIDDDSPPAHPSLSAVLLAQRATCSLSPMETRQRLQTLHQYISRPERKASFTKSTARL
ncbi:hypothetical protein FF011L_17160 [Roseimaritima multifibrata]|uniref:Uncharacterized protein n=1 Tax=Roseimaritima multifibrata TaxID=1930274 RepID=A0A517MDJ5_9BACT|nr:hypothetical protein FF011L_17160 [Roseimaritima multifibrata]